MTSRMLVIGLGVVGLWLASAILPIPPALLFIAGASLVLATRGMR